MAVGAGFTAGALDHRVQILRAAISDDGLQQVETFAAHGAPVWASRRDVSDGERWQAGQVNADITTRFLLRGSGFSRDLTAKDRMTCNGVTYDIAGLKVIGRGEWVEVTARARVDL